MKQSKYELLVGVTVYMPFYNSVKTGTVKRVFSDERNKENFLEVSWEKDLNNELQKIFSIKKDIGIKIFFEKRTAVFNSLVVKN